MPKAESHLTLIPSPTQIEDDHPAIDDLIFVKKRKRPKGEPTARNYWAVARTGRWGFDNLIGAKLADEAVTFMKEAGQPTLLASIVESMIDEAVCEGVEVGFLHRIGEHLIGVAK